MPYCACPLWGIIFYTLRWMKFLHWWGGFLQVGSSSWTNNSSGISSLLLPPFIAETSKYQWTCRMCLFKSLANSSLCNNHCPFAAFPKGLALALKVFTKVLAPVLDLLNLRGIPVREQIFLSLVSNVSIRIQTLEDFGLILIFEKSSLILSHCLKYLVLFLIPF